MARGILLAVTLLMSGCVTELIAAPELTVRTYTCAVLDPDRAEGVGITAWGDDPFGATEAVRIALIKATGRDAEAFSLDRRPAVAPDEAWMDEQNILTSRAIHLHLVFVSSLPDNRTTDLIMPGILAIAVDTIAVVAQGQDEAAIGRTMVLHGLGHALGVVNRGIPINATTLAGHEASPGHEPAMDSVMHVGWHRGNGIDGLQPADRYSDAVRADWARAMQPGGACA